MNIHHRRALKVVTLAVLLDAALGAVYAQAMHISTWNGLYYATGIATTSGNSADLPHGWLPHAVTVLLMITVIPLFACTFSLVTTGFTADHVDKRHGQAGDEQAGAHAELGAGIGQLGARLDLLLRAVIPAPGTQAAPAARRTRVPKAKTGKTLPDQGESMTGDQDWPGQK